jgi:hypothetical protein
MNKITTFTIYKTANQIKKNCKRVFYNNRQGQIRSIGKTKNVQKKRTQNFEEFEPKHTKNVRHIP